MAETELKVVLQDERPAEVRHPATGSGATWPIFEVFRQERAGRPLEHAGNLTAPARGIVSHAIADPTRSLSPAEAGAGSRCLLNRSGDLRAGRFRATIPRGGEHLATRGSLSEHQTTRRMSQCRQHPRRRHSRDASPL